MGVRKMVAHPCEACGSLSVDVYKSPLTEMLKIECDDCGQRTGFFGAVEDALAQWNSMQENIVAERKRCEWSELEMRKNL